MDAPSVQSVAVAQVAATAAQNDPDVLGLHGGAMGEVATYGQDGPVQGVRVRRTPAPRLQLRLVVRFGARLDDVADEVRGRVRAAMAAQVPAFADATVDVHIADVRSLAGTEQQDASASSRESGGPAPYDATARPRNGDSARQP